MVDRHTFTLLLFVRNFTKQLALYDGPTFIKVNKLQQLLFSSPYPLGRAYGVIVQQLKDPVYEKLLIRGEEDD